MNLKVPSWIAVILLGVILIMWLMWPEKGTSDREKDLQSYNQDLQLRIDSIADRNRAILNEVRKDSLRGVQIQDSLRTQANRFRGQVVKLKANPIIIRVREEVPEVDSLIIAQDSIIANQGYAIAAYEHQLSKLQVNLVGITANFESMLSAERHRYANSQEIIALKNKELKKKRRESRVLKILIPVAFGLGLLIK